MNWIKYGLIFSMIGVILSCGTEPNIDPSLAPLLKEYRELTKHKIGFDLNTLKIGTFEDKKRLGVCDLNFQTNQRNIIVVPYDPVRFSLLSYKVLVFHELGHCIHKLQHDETVLIMNSKLTASRGQIAYFWDLILEEFVELINEEGAQ